MSSKAKSARGAVPVSQNEHGGEKRGINANESKISEVQNELAKTTDVLRENMFVPRPLHPLVLAATGSPRSPSPTFLTDS
jgi:hypothetical protein